MRLRKLFQSYRHSLYVRLGHATRRQRLFLLVAAFCIVAGAAGSLWTLLRVGTVTIPSAGGKLDIGMTGSVRFVNPVLASSETDRDVSNLVFSGLMHRNPDGSIVPDLAESYEISPDGRTYTFTIRKDAKFHDGTAITADDVVFTIRKAQDATIKSPWLISWIDVGVNRIDDRTISFTLKSPYGGFLLATTIGILPSERWLPETDADGFEFNPENTHPVGSGPYRIKRVIQKGGRIVRYELVSWKHASPRPWIRRVNIRLYASEESMVSAFKRNAIDIASGLKAGHADMFADARGVSFWSEPLPRVFALFLNATKVKALSDAPVRQALDIAIDRQALVRETLGGYGTAIDTLLPLADHAGASAARPDAALKILEGAGWKADPATGIRSKSIGGQTVTLSFAIATASTPELADTARMIAEQLQPLGFDVSVQVFDLGTLDRDIIRPRAYDALLFGDVYRHDTDAYAFWHSSQRTDPGLNIAHYADPRVDRALERAFASNDTSVRDSAYQEVNARLDADRPAIALYQPNHVTVARHTLRGRPLRDLIIPSDRFADITSWFVRSDTRWPFLLSRETQSKE